MSDHDAVINHSGGLPRDMRSIEIFDQGFVRQFDLRESGPGSAFTLVGHQYWQRVRAIRLAIRQYAGGRRVIDLGCAQGTIALELAALGFAVTAVDSNQAFLDYARSKDRSRQVSWVCGDAHDMAVAHPYDAAVLAEVIEHTGRPQQLVRAVASMLRPGGALVLTTPNGERIRQRLPSFTQWQTMADESTCLQFGPAGEHHQFLFTRRELEAILSPWFESLTIRAISSAAWNHHTEPLLRTRAGRLIMDQLERLILAVRPLATRVANQWLITARRRSLP
jgi:2-polyprenyl-3-methyl-5-hydroxy-6-metoxy-1,4-benzoquinol methylase